MSTLALSSCVCRSVTLVCPSCTSFLPCPESHSHYEQTRFAGVIEMKGIRLRGAPMYLDMQATTPLDPRVLDAMLPYMVDQVGHSLPTRRVLHVYVPTDYAAPCQQDPRACPPG